jgi:hypothetical protein
MPPPPLKPSTNTGDADPVQPGPRPPMGRVEKAAWGVGGVGAVLLTIYGAIMIIPKAIGQAFFPWLPQEFQGPAISVCSCSSCLCSGIILILMVASKFS